MADDNEETKEKKSSSGMSDLARKIFLTSVGAIFMTEDAIRRSLSDLKVPTEAMGGLIDSVRKQKDDLLEMIAGEVGRFLSKIKVSDELQKALKGMQVHVDARISFHEPKKESKESAAATTSKIRVVRHASEEPHDG